MRFVLFQAMVCKQLGKVGTIDPASYVMPRRNGKECARVVVKSNSVVETSRLCCGFTEAQHSLRAVVEPPGWPKFETRIMPGKWGQFSAVCGFVQSKQDD